MPTDAEGGQRRPKDDRPWPQLASVGRLWPPLASVGLRWSPWAPFGLLWAHSDSCGPTSLKLIWCPSMQELQNECFYNVFHAFQRK